MEVSIGLYSLAVPFLFSGLGRFFIAAAHGLGESPRVMIALRVVTAVLALAPPTLLMGGTLPVLARFAAAGQKRPGETVGWLYAANTAGAVLGCFVTGCLLIIWLGVIETGVAAAGIDLVVGLIALYWDRRQHQEVTGESARGRGGSGQRRGRSRGPAPPFGSRRSRGSAGWPTSCSGHGACWRR